jgi:nitrite reductase/ring-hydroxylating ferredoxin subunit/uncharacterized membrane protein
MIELVEGSELLSRLSGSTRRSAAALLEGKRFRNVLSGSWLGHPVHPVLVAFPLGMWSAALLSDLTGDSESARRLTVAGLAGALPASATGLSDWLDTAGAEQRVGLAHMGANVAASTIVGAGWLLRRGGRRRAGAALGAAGLLVAAFGGWLGGHLAYALGVGVDTNAFDGGPTEWSVLAMDPSAERTGSSEMWAAQADGISLAVIASDEEHDGWAVLANRCSHRGGPLAEGAIDGPCVRCPWHGSKFDIASGAVVRGPATAAQPTYQLRRNDDGWQVRRDEQRALRSNSVRVRS